MATILNQVMNSINPFTTSQKVDPYVQKTQFPRNQIQFPRNQQQNLQNMKTIQNKKQFQTLKRNKKLQKKQTKSLVNTVKKEEIPPLFSENNMVFFHNMPYEFEMSEDNEIYNEGSRNRVNAEVNAVQYIEANRKQLLSAKKNTVVPANECKAVIIHRQNDYPLMLDHSNYIMKTIGHSIYKSFDTTNEPIYIIHSSGPIQVTPDFLKENYVEFFTSTA